MLLNKAPLHEVSARTVGHHDAWRVANPAATDMPPYVLEAMADQALANRDWQTAWGLYVEALRSGSILVDQRKCTLNSGRCALHLNEVSPALAMLSEFVETFPGDPDGLFYLGRAFQRARRFHDALNCLATAQQLDPVNPAIHSAVGQIAHALAFQGFGHTDGARSGSYLAVAEIAFTRALDIEPANLEALSGRLMLRLDCGKVEEAVASFESLLTRRETFDEERLSRVAINLALALARGGHLNQVARLDYLAEFAAGERILVRALALLGEDRAAQPPTAAGAIAIHFDPAANAWVAGPCREKGWFGPRVRGNFGNPWEALSVAADWVVPLRTTHWGAVRKLTARLAELPAGFAGIATCAADGEATNLVLRKRAWDELVSAQPSRPDWPEATRLALDRLRLFSNPTELGATEAPDAALGAPSGGPNRVLVLSRHGPKRLGGGEQFLADAAKQYAARPATEVLFAGVTDDPAEAIEAWPGERPLAEGFLSEDAAALRAFCLANRVTAIHTISGLGELVLDACAGLNVRFVYGVHFWREFVAGRVLSQPFYPHFGRDGSVEPAPIFGEILARADFAYVNSDYCRDLAERLYNWRPPVLYSAPAGPDVGQAPPSRTFWQKDYVLLANCRADKGWSLLLDIAAALPGRQFVAVAGQTDAEAARADVQHRNLFNLTVVERTGEMDTLYRHARLVVVPSFAFVETFSRVAIEAGRHGKPILMADAGNLSRLGAGTGLLLPEYPGAWIGAIERLYDDAEFHTRLTAQSVALSERFSHRELLDDLARLPVTVDRERILVCVGSGIGNVCHTTPTIRRLATHYGVRVDVLVAGDFPGTGALLAGAPFVASVFETYTHVAHRAYDQVFVTHSFGTVVPAFNCPTVHVSRDADLFDPAGELHEAEFNLAFLKSVTGIGYVPEDVGAYFLGNWRWSPVVEPSRASRVAVHAGSKDGIWVAKRWPHFPALARTLARLGVDVVSLGVAGEYVPGTIDKTGLTIERMTDELTLCDVLVTNDSGVMNIANAIGMPVIALFAPTNPATRAPLNSRSIVLAAETDCAPCESKPGFAERFQQGACRCIALISPARVRNALAGLGLPIPETID